MKPFFVDTIATQIPEKGGVDGSYIWLNCKKINFELNKGDIVKYSRNGHVLYIEDIEVIKSDMIFSHWKLSCKIITNNKQDYVKYDCLESGQYFYKPEYSNE